MSEKKTPERRIWTPEMDSMLLECADAAIKMGLHPQLSVKLKRNKELANAVNFWSGVAILFAEKAGSELDECPTPNACSKRYMKALNYWTDPERDSYEVRKMTGVLDNLKALDGEWMRLDAEIYRDMSERLLAASDYVAIMADEIKNLTVILDFDGRATGRTGDDNE